MQLKVWSNHVKQQKMIEFKFKQKNVNGIYQIKDVHSRLSGIKKLK